MKYPFLYAVPVDAESPGAAFEKWVVKIASVHDLAHYDAAWMGDPNLGHVLVPDLDLEESSTDFSSEMAALKFIQEWWGKQKL